MHDIEPYHKWRDDYISSEDPNSPMYNYINSELEYTHQIYNHLIHPQWDDFGSETLFLKIIFADYDLGYCFIEFIGEWNDAITNDVMLLKRNVIDKLIDSGIYKFVLLTENILNYHGDEDCYYEEWLEEISEDHGWICMLNTQGHVLYEMEQYQLQLYLTLGEPFDDIVWRGKKPEHVFLALEILLRTKVHQLSF